MPRTEAEIRAALALLTRGFQCGMYSEIEQHRILGTITAFRYILGEEICNPTLADTLATISALCAAKDAVIPESGA